MSRMEMIDPNAANGRTKLLFDGLVKRRGRVSHMVRVLANSPAAVNAYFSFNAALSGGELPIEIRERIAIAVAQANGCSSCLAAHTEFGRTEGISNAELDAARDGQSQDPKITAALHFALSAMRNVGDVTDSELAMIRENGFSEAAIMEMIATVFINVFTNAVNHIAHTVPDYPEVPQR